MKKICAVLGCLLLTFCLLLSGCSKLEMPSSDGVVYGNGGTVVQKGEYVYFANAYTGYSALENDVSNKKGKAGLYSLYRVKTKDVNGTLELDEQGLVANAEKVVGFEYSNLYIVNDYLYFSSPNMHKTKSGENRFDLISIFKVKLDGSGLKELYTTEEYTSSNDWTICNIQNTNYLVTYEGNEIVRQEINNKGNLKDRTVLASDITNAILPENQNYSNDNKVYFTTKRSGSEDGLTGNVLKYVEIASEKQVVLRNNGDTVTLVDYKYGNLFYTVSGMVDDGFVFVNDLNGNEQRLTMWKVSNVNIASVMNQGLKLIYTYQSKLVIQDFDSYQTEVLVDGNATVINIDEDYVYYTLDNKISRVSLVDRQTTEIYEDKNMDKNFDFDSRYIYLFTNTENNKTNTKYMYRIDTFALEQGLEIKAQPMGEINPDDLTAEEE